MTKGDHITTSHDGTDTLQSDQVSIGTQGIEMTVTIAILMTIVTQETIVTIVTLETIETLVTPISGLNTPTETTTPDLPSATATTPSTTNDAFTHLTTVANHSFPQLSSIISN